jgi:hypothetical protein
MRLSLYAFCKNWLRESFVKIGCGRVLWKSVDGEFLRKSVEGEFCENRIKGEFCENRLMESFVKIGWWRVSWKSVEGEYCKNRSRESFVKIGWGKTTLNIRAKIKFCSYFPYFSSGLGTIRYWKCTARPVQFLHTYRPIKMEQTERSETSACKIQAPGNYPEESIQQFAVVEKPELFKVFCPTSRQYEGSLPSSQNSPFGWVSRLTVFNFF